MCRHKRHFEFSIFSLLPKFICREPDISANYTASRNMEGINTYPDDLSEATLDHVAELIREGDSSGEIIEEEDAFN